jgi:Xaa-Pro aminopeptidase
MDTLETSRAEVRQRIAALRAAMKKHDLAGYVVPTADPHLSEYPPSRYGTREWLTGFTGSVGTLLVTADFAGLWVDSRYYVQAEAELAGTGIEMMRLDAVAALGHVDWLSSNAQKGTRVGVDAQVLGVASGRALATALEARGVSLVTDLDLADEVWLDRPALPAAPVTEHASMFATTSRKEKLAAVRSAMQAHGADVHLISSLDDIAWLFNLRGADVEYNPVFVAHALIEKERARLFIGEGKIAAPLAAALKADGVDIEPYQDTTKALSALADGQAILVDPRRVTLGMTQAIAKGVKVIDAINPSTLAKSQKTNSDIAHVREAMRRDGLALAEFFAWFESALGRERITELTVDEKLTAERAKQPDFVSQSFSTIAAFNANGAMPHYRATEQSHAVIEGDGLLLIDSGGQYLCGTTDITRVVPIGTPSAEQKRDYTLVLKGMINLSVAVFPRGTRSGQLDALARAPIWAAGVEYGHGTGHGVGYFLNVHEGPQSISPSAPNDASTAMLPGMITSNEPGIYRPGQWGVRIENLVANVVKTTTQFGDFLGFETLTMCPIDTRCIDFSLMRSDELTWLDHYHATVFDRLSSGLSSGALAWLKERTMPVAGQK